MTGRPKREWITLLDACAVLSLYATGRMDEIISAIPGPVAIADLVRDETLYVRRIVAGVVERVPVDLEPLIDSGLIVVVSAEEDAELDTFIDLTLELDDGEAMSAALTLHRRSLLVTDDRKAIRLLTGRIEIEGALTFVKRWADAGNVEREVLRDALFGIYNRGYQPPRYHPLKVWWDFSIDP